MSAAPVRAFLIGCVHSSDVALETLIDDPNVNLRGVLTLRKSSFNADYVDIAARARDAGIPVHFAEDMAKDAMPALLRDNDVQALFVIGWSRLIPGQVLEVPEMGTVGFHPAALPANRGRHPLIWALVLGLRETASTFFLMDKGADTGPVLSQVPLDIADDDDAAALYARVIAVMPDQIRTIAARMRDGTLSPEPQDHSLATTWRKRGTADGLVDWRMPATGIHNLVRALARPYIGAEIRLGDDTVKLWRCEVVDGAVPANAEPGKVIQTGPSGPVIKAGIGAVRLLETSEMPDLAEGDYL